jgi:serine/threonine-protein kinase
LTNESDVLTVAGSKDADLEPGTRVGEFVLEEKIGAGGFGAVYRAVHPLIGKVVAIKVLGRKLSADPEMVSRFVAEARSVNQIGSRYIIDIFGFGALEDSRQYYIMEYLDGMPLDEYLEDSPTSGAPVRSASGGRLDSGCVGLAEALPILRGIAKALDAAHGSGIAHRDLKPENVFLVADEQGGFRPKLLDFGIAKLLGEAETMHKTRTGSPIGTPFYMSPEQCRGKGVDHRTDIYAFGCMTYRILTGQVPFDSDSYMDILFQQIQAEPPPPTSINPALPPGIDSIIASLMAKNPDDRPPNLATAIKALERCATDGGVPVASGPVSAVLTPVPVAASGRERETARGDAATVAATPDSLAPIRRRGGLLFAALAVLALVGGATAFFALKSRSSSMPAAVRDELAPLAESESEPEPEPAEASEPEPMPEPSAEPPFVTVEIVGAPEGTEVSWAPEGLIGTAPGTVQLARGEAPLTLLLRAAGHRPTAVDVVPDRDRVLEVALEPVRAATAAKKPRRPPRKRAPAPRRGKDSIEDPFQ